jgi:hypothetical protein
MLWGHQVEQYHISKKEILHDENENRQINASINNNTIFFVTSTVQVYVYM